MRLSDIYYLLGKPSQESFRSEIESNPDELYRLLDDHLKHRFYTVLSERIPSGENCWKYEWMINPFQFARQVIHQNGHVGYEQLAEYLNNSSVWNNAAPHYFDSSAWTRVIQPMLEYSDQGNRQALANTLDRKGLLSNCFKQNGYGPEVVNREWKIRIL